MSVITTPCRFCHSDVTVPLPEDERMNRFIRTLATKACCNRCADYHRSLRSMADALQVLALSFESAKDDPKRAERTGDFIYQTCQMTIELVENHYLVSGFLKDTPALAANVKEKPGFAAYFVRQTDKGIREAARGVHRAQPQPKMEQTEYAY